MPVVPVAVFRMPMQGHMLGAGGFIAGHMVYTV